MLSRERYRYRCDIQRGLAGTKGTVMGDSGEFVEETGEKISAAGEK